MLEVVFTESAKASMEIAKKQKSIDIIDGNTQDVVCIGFHLDIGNISGEVDGIQRQEVFNNIFNYNDFDKKETEKFFNEQRENIEELLLAAKHGVPIRVWKSNMPFASCAFAYICDLLRHIDCKISLVSLPEYLVMPNDTIVSYTSWGEISPEEFHKFLSYEKELSKIEKIVHANLWQDLKAENSILRAVVNGKLISVPENFYDHLIINNIPDEEFIMYRLIGNILGKYPLGVGDGWYAFRINKMIEENRLKVISDISNSHPYGKVLKKISL